MIFNITIHGNNTWIKYVYHTWVGGLNISSTGSVFKSIIQKNLLQVSKHIIWKLHIKFHYWYLKWMKKAVTPPPILVWYTYLIQVLFPCTVMLKVI